MELDAYLHAADRAAEIAADRASQEAAHQASEQALTEYDLTEYNPADEHDPPSGTATPAPTRRTSTSPSPNRSHP